MAAIAVMASLVATGTTPADAATTGARPTTEQLDPTTSKICDTTGDRRGRDDCVRHRALGRASDNEVQAGQRFRVRLSAHRAVRGTRMDSTVQVRPINAKGTAFTARWRSIKELRWTAQRHEVVNLRAPHEVGGYALRVTTTTIPRAMAAGEVSAADTGLTAVSATTPLAAVSPGCPNSPDDTVIIEFFDEVVFSQGFSFDIWDGDVPNGMDVAPGTFRIDLNCPEQQTPYWPPPEFGMRVSTADGSESAGCNSGSITLLKSDLSDYPFCSETNCSFIVTADNRDTGAVYSTTEVMLSLTGGDDNYVPNLNPAMLPFCTPTIRPCVLTESCGLD